jgi:hypothetical protein
MQSGGRNETKERKHEGIKVLQIILVGSSGRLTMSKKR